MEQIAISVDGAAKALGLGRTSIYALLKSNELESIKVGRRRLLTTKSIHALIEKQRQEAAHG